MDGLKLTLVIGTIGPIHHQPRLGSSSSVRLQLRAELRLELRPPTAGVLEQHHLRLHLVACVQVVGS